MAVLAVSACARTEAPPARRTASDVRLPRETDVIEATVPPHATLDGLLRANRLREDLIAGAVEAARAVFNPRRLRTGQPYRLVRSLDGLLREFEYGIDTDRFLRITSSDRDSPEAMSAQVLDYDKQ